MSNLNKALEFITSTYQSVLPEAQYKRVLRFIKCAIDEEPNTLNPAIGQWPANEDEGNGNLVYMAWVGDVFSLDLSFFEDGTIEWFFTDRSSEFTDDDLKYANLKYPEDGALYYLKRFPVKD
jgi:hypothetical protein